MTAAPIAPVQAWPLPPVVAAVAQSTGVQAAQNGSFSQLLVDGVDHLNGELTSADKLAQSFALDDTVPVHQVAFALANAKLSLELAMQVRGRLVEAYQQLMNMQL
jgi:flagellar hook-basal body complex protein FliE